MFELSPIWPNFTLVKYAFELGQIITRYDFLEAMRVILSNIQTDSNFT